MFSWNLSRFTLTGWFGVGYALKALKENKLSEYNELKEKINTWPFLRFMFIQIETNLILANSELMKEYANMVSDDKIKQDFLNMILTDYESGIFHIEELMGKPALERRTGQLENLNRREKELKILHELHIKHLKEWRAIKNTNPLEAEKLLTKLLSITNSLSIGLKNTG